MENRLKLLALVTVTAIAGTNSAMAGAEVGSWYVAPKAVYVDPDKVFNVDENIGVSLAIGKVLSESWDGELAWVESHHDSLLAGNKLKLAGPELNFSRVFLRERAVNPFIGFGLSSIRYRDPATGSYDRDVGASIKAGVLADLTRNGGVQLSAEVGKRSDDFTKHLEDVFGGLGLRFNFGAPKKVTPVAAVIPVAEVSAPAPVVTPTPPVDSDGDGVIDSADQCPATPAGSKVNSNGCELDADRDGVVDRLDRCPNTPVGDKVDTAGCGLTIALQVQFDTNSANIKPESYSELDTFVAFMKESPSVKGVLEGHTDNAGADAYNLTLSQRRADAVKAYAVSKGVNASRIDASGIGEARPIADNKTAEGRAANRRVQFVRAEL